MANGLLHRANGVGFFSYPVEFPEIRDPVSDFITVQSKRSGQFVDSHWFIEGLKNFKPAVVPIRQVLDAVLKRCGHSISLLKFDQDFVREGSELVVIEPFDLSFEFISNDVVVETSLHEHIQILDVVVTARNQCEQHLHAYHCLVVRTRVHRQAPPFTAGVGD